MASQFLLEGRSLDELAREATEAYGPGARIVRAERVLDAGIAGFLGRRHLEVTVEVPSAGPAGVAPASTAPVRPASSALPAPHVLGDRSGILALLESADRAEDDVNTRSVPSPAATTVPSADRPVAPATPEPVSTQSPVLSELLSRLGEDRDGRAVPVPLCAAGDLVLVLGLDDTARRVARSMSDSSEGAGRGIFAIYGAGATEPSDGGRPDGRRLDGRWAAVQARAIAVEAQETVLAAYALGSPAAGLPHLDGVAALDADQVWLVVDARHKPDDTAAWVDRVRATVHVDALAVVGVGESRSAHTVNSLRVPIGWMDGMPAPRTVL